MRFPLEKGKHLGNASPINFSSKGGSVALICSGTTSVGVCSSYPLLVAKSLDSNKRYSLPALPKSKRVAGLLHLPVRALIHVGTTTCLMGVGWKADFLHGITAANSHY